MMLKRIRELLGKRRKPDATANGAAAQSAAGSAAAAEAPPVHRGPTVAHHPIADVDLDPDAVKIVRRLTRFDHKAYLVGGCVRDLLLDRRPKDFDVGTSATPRQMKRLFRNCRIIGRRFRLAHIYFQHGKIIEVATFRARDVDEDDESAGKDLLIREDNVFGTPEEDALRRDFTINSLFYDVNDGTVIDHADGLNDLRQRLVRTIGDPEIRFREDPVRILRAVKFAARLDFRIERRTLAALGRTRREIEKAAPPRVLEEIARFGREGAARRSFELLRETDVLRVILPEVDAACAENGAAWELLLDLLDHTDRERRGNDRPIRMGETFAVLLLSALAKEFGWNEDGTVEPPEGVELREVVDERLRPMALRLRIPRREQEYCRQVLLTLQRIVGKKRMRGGARRALAGRECFADVLWILGRLAQRYGGAFAAARESWSDLQPARATRDETRRDGTSRRRRGRRGRRARGRSSGGDRAEAATASSRPGDSRTPRKRTAAVKARPAGTRPAKGAPDGAMPSPWDDDYFFAALPTLPDEAEASAPPRKEARGDVDGPIDEDAPRRRRRRRRRRKRPATARGEEGVAQFGKDGTDPDDGGQES